MCGCRPGSRRPGVDSSRPARSSREGGPPAERCCGRKPTQGRGSFRTLEEAGTSRRPDTDPSSLAAPLSPKPKLATVFTPRR